MDPHPSPLLRGLKVSLKDMGSWDVLQMLVAAIILFFPQMSSVPMLKMCLKAHWESRSVCSKKWNSRTG